MNRLCTLLLVVNCLAQPFISVAQGNTNFTAIASAYVREHADRWGLVDADLDSMPVSHIYTDPASGLTRVYFQQYVKGIPVYNALINVNLDKTGIVYHAGCRFVNRVQEKTNSHVPVISAGQAIAALASHLRLPYATLRIAQDSGRMQIFEGGVVSRDDIPVFLTYLPVGDSLILTWDVLLTPHEGHDKWSTRMDARTGEVLDEYNWTTYCFDSDLQYDYTGTGPDENCTTHSVREYRAAPEGVTESQYRVWPAPMSGPLQGERVLVANPADSLASPFGWHDTNGQPGHEYTITRGNNVHAFQDRNNLFYSSGDEPDGGASLNFDFPVDLSAEPGTFTDAAVVNLFYWINYMHDFAYGFGFNEVSGNFQQNNYGRGGQGGDALFALAQQGANTGEKNNAYYSHTRDGVSGASIRMHPFYGAEWFLEVNSPATAAGRYVTSFPSAGWGEGTYLDGRVITGEVVYVNDGVEAPYSSDACEPILNSAALQGKIALMDRGGCEFGWKALQVQQAGAIAALVCNHDDDSYTMNPGTYGAEVHIPILMIGASDCQTVSQHAGNGLFVTFADPGQIGADSLDSDFDNTLIAHEFAHGITSRLVGDDNANCLTSLESMSEGWSDFYALAATARPGDTGIMERGFGSYVTRSHQAGRGFRRFPYSTDMTVMPLTYGDVASSQEIHNIGEVWASALWDMYWALVEKYGWSEDPHDSSSGNYRAIRLVMEGQKNCVCNPGFVDGRDAILAADVALYEGVDTCMLWEVFARRGLGYSADQGSPYDAGDQREAFDLPPVCAGDMLLTKSVTDVIQAGNVIEVKLHIGNYKPDSVTHVVLTDEIPDGTTYHPGSSTYPVSIEGNTLQFDLGTMLFGDTLSIAYTLISDANAWSERIYLDPLDQQSSANWLTYTIGNGSNNDWQLNDQVPTHTGDYAWTCAEAAQRSRKALELDADAYAFRVAGERPVLRFYHRYETKAGINGGVVDVKNTDATSWSSVAGDMIRNGYTTEVDYRTFISPNVYAFSGNSGATYKATYVDLADWMGEDIHVRFRFGTDDNTNDGIGWYIDDIEFMDMLAYNGEACVSSDQGDFVCAVAPDGGTIVDSREPPVSTSADSDYELLYLYPNPANDIVTLTVPQHEMHNIEVGIFAMDGTLQYGQSFRRNGEQLHLDLAHLPAGLYIVEINAGGKMYAGKLTII